MYTRSIKRRSAVYDIVREQLNAESISKHLPFVLQLTVQPLSDSEQNVLDLHSIDTTITAQLIDSVVQSFNEIFSPADFYGFRQYVKASETIKTKK